MRTVALAVTDGMSLFEVAIPYTVFGPSGLYSMTFAYELVVCATPDARLTDWLSVRAPHGLDRLPDADIVVVPACDRAVESPPSDLVTAVRDAYERGARIASICTGAFVLAAAGLLDGRRATTHWMYADRLARDHPGIDVDPGVLYVDEGVVLTAAGQAAGIDLCLHIVRSDLGATMANALARRLVASPHRSGGQAQFVSHHRATGNRAGGDGRDLSALLQWALERLHEPLTVTDLAHRAHVSPRHLARLFATTVGVSPLHWLLNQRVGRAQELLESTDDTIDEIARSVGIGTATTLRRHFNRLVGLSPDGYRRAFRQHRPDPRTEAGAGRPARRSER